MKTEGLTFHDIEALRREFLCSKARVGLFLPMPSGNFNGDIDLLCNPEDTPIINRCLQKWANTNNYILSQVIQHGPMAWALIFTKFHSATLLNVAIDLHYGIHKGIKRIFAFSDLGDQNPFIYEPNHWPHLKSEFSWPCYLGKQVAKNTINTDTISALIMAMQTTNNKERFISLTSLILGLPAREILSLGKDNGVYSNKKLVTELSASTSRGRMGRFVFYDFLRYIQFATKRIMCPVGCIVGFDPSRPISASALNSQLQCIFPGGIIMRRKIYEYWNVVDVLRRRLVLVPSKKLTPESQSLISHIREQAILRTKKSWPFYFTSAK